MHKVWAMRLERTCLKPGLQNQSEPNYRLHPDISKNLPNPYQSIFGVSDHLYFF